MNVEKLTAKKIFLTGLGLFVLAAALKRSDEILAFCGKLIGLLFPVLLGVLFAVVLSRPAAAAERISAKLFGRFGSRTCRCIALAVIYLLIAGAVILIISIIIPQLADSISLFINSFDGYYNNFLELESRLYKRTGLAAAKWISGALDSLIGYVSGRAPSFAEKAVTVTSSFISAVTDMIFALVISVYILLDREKFRKAAAKLPSLFMSEEKRLSAVRYIGIITDCFSKFICGQLMEAVILGGLCFLGMAVLGFDYPLLIGTMIGVTALIPIAGAFIGTVPAAFMLFLIEPSQALWFVVFIIILQQLENNLIYPKVVGRSVGLPPVLILIAILFGAGLGGVGGILIGVPAASVIYVIAKDKLSDNGG